MNLIIIQFFFCGGYESSTPCSGMSGRSYMVLDSAPEKKFILPGTRLPHVDWIMSARLSKCFCAVITPMKTKLLSASIV